MNPFLLFCFTALCFSPVLAFAIGLILWYVEQFPEHKTPPPVPQGSSRVYTGLTMHRKGVL